MTADASVRFFDAQFQQQLHAADLALNPFEQAALPYLSGRVLDHGCGLGNLAVAAARRGCSILALDASPTAIAHLRQRAQAESLPIEAHQVDVRTYALSETFDSVVSIGLLMFFDAPTAWRQLAQLQAQLRPGGVAVINVLVQGTTYLDMFDPSGHCLFDPDALLARFAGWDMLQSVRQEFPAPGGQLKSFLTLIARKRTEPLARSTRHVGA
jgi:tellurite methyltransferase